MTLAVLTPTGQDTGCGLRELVNTVPSGQHGVAVLPVEWWDPKWIDDNISPKLAGRSSEAVAEEQRAARPRKAATRRR